MRPPALLLACFLLAAPAIGAEPGTTGDCALARDPARCEVRQAAIRTCADLRGNAKRTCLDANLPPADCTRAANPAGCDAAQKAKQACQGKTGKALKACLRDEAPRKKKRPAKRPAG